MELWLLEAITTLFVAAAEVGYFGGSQTCTPVRSILFKNGLLVDGGLKEVTRWGRE